MILVTGGTGFIGRRLVARLVGAGEGVRIIARAGADIPGAEVVAADVRDASAVARAAQGCAAVIHLVGIIRERRGAGFEEMHVGGTRAVVEACSAVGVARLLHMSALGARPNATSRYHQTKWEGEELVRASGLAATVFRPSVIFGAGNSFLPQVRSLLHRGPLIPIVGDGSGRLQPVWVEDVVSCFVGALQRSETTGRAYELGGPEVFTFEQLVDLLAAAQGVRKPKAHIPLAVMRPIVWVMSRLVPAFPLTSDQLSMLLEDNICDTASMRETFDIAPAPLREHLSD